MAAGHTIVPWLVDSRDSRAEHGWCHASPANHNPLSCFCHGCHGDSVPGQDECSGSYFIHFLYKTVFKVTLHLPQCFAPAGFSAHWRRTCRHSGPNALTLRSLPHRKLEKWHQLRYRLVSFFIWTWSKRKLSETRETRENIWKFEKTSNRWRPWFPAPWRVLKAASGREHKVLSSVRSLQQEFNITHML